MPQAPPRTNCQLLEYPSFLKARESELIAELPELLIVHKSNSLLVIDDPRDKILKDSSIYFHLGGFQKDQSSVCPKQSG